MSAGERKETWDRLHRFRTEHMTFWPKSHPVMFPHLQTDHWSKMKIMVPVYFATVPAALLKDTVNESHEAVLNNTTSSNSVLLPQLTKKDLTINDPVLSTVQAYSIHLNKPKISPQNMPQYRNKFNDRAKQGFRYWLIEKKTPTCKRYCFGAYKTPLGLPKV
ncbi:hypothetical protein Q5P01_001736 [Channa striata]|uniref:Uncharacterized protein n=1 Tax=Channa striata TaxID=64152 RepID=A0AA88T5J3_CHASR|nr:hypothetical protein Q5P01_001736 [Channa striata]